LGPLGSKSPSNKPTDCGLIYDLGQKIPKLTTPGRRGGGISKGTVAWYGVLLKRTNLVLRPDLVFREKLQRKKGGKTI